MDAHNTQDKKRPRSSPSSDDSNLEPQLKKPLFATPPHFAHIPSSSTTEQPKQKAKGKFVYKYGNYAGYYGYRLDASGNDPRIDLLDSKWFTGKKVLDIGCNSGVLTIRLAKKHAVESIYGVDIDKSLISRASKNLESATASSHPLTRETKPHKHTFHGGGKLSWDVASSSNSELPSISTASSPSSSTIAHHEPTIGFEAVNYLTKSTEPNSYDTILCLSVVKWIHLNWGDAGLRSLLLKVRTELKEDGVFILEIQPISSYRKVKNLTKTIRMNWETNKIKPEGIPELAAQLGLRLLTTIQPSPASKGKHGEVGFSRPIHVFQKSAIPAGHGEIAIEPAAPSAPKSSL